MSIEKNKDKVISIRMNSEDFTYLKVAAFSVGLTPSRLLRMLADSTISGIKLKVSKGEISDADIKAILDHQL